MGKASRWLRSLLLGGRKPAAVAGGDTHKPIKEKRGWGFARSFRDVDPHRREVLEDEMSVAVNEVRKGASYREGAPRSYAPSVASSRATGGVPSRAPPPPPPAVDNEEQQKRAIAVAAATAAVAEAAVAAAQAAAAVVRLTSSGRCPALYGAIGRKREEWAAVRIQAAFRGYLARRALRALRGLVKLQALVRGHIVRKQAAETLRCMQALVRVQARVRACRGSSENRLCNDGSRQSHLGPLTPQKFEPSLRANHAKSDKGSSNLKRGDVIDFIDPSSAHSWKWMDRWMEERYWDSREASWRTGGATDDEKNDKILEVDTGKPHSNYKRRGNHVHSSSTTLQDSDLNSRCFAAAQDSPSKDSFVQFSIPSTSSAVDMQQPLSPLRFAPEAGELAYESPQVLYPASSRPGSARGPGPFCSPAKSECSSRSFFGGYSDHPSYMANTESSRAKLRSQSAPKQRPDCEKLSTLRRVQVVGAGCGHSSSSSSQRSASGQLQLKFTSKDYPVSGRLDRMGMPMRF